MHQTKVIRFDHPPTPTDLDVLRARGLAIIHVSQLAPEVTVRAAGAAGLRALVAEVRALPGVAGVEDDFEVRATLREAGPLVRIADLWATVRPAIDGPFGRFAAAVVAGGYQGQGITVGILDTGLDDTYPGFEGRVVSEKDYTDEGAGDGHGHGTHVAGICGQTEQAELGYVGMAPQCRFRIYKVLSSSGSGSASGIAQALEDALADGCDLVSLSLGGEAPSAEPDFLQRRADAVGERIPVVVAAGNSGPKGAKPFRETPARAANVITVGASEKDDDVASFSSRGVTDDGRVKPNVYAPGHQIAAARAAGTTMGTPLSDRLTVASGTSMAAPLIAGVVASWLSLDPALRGQPRRIKAALLIRGQDIRAEAYRVIAPDLLRPPYPPDPAEGDDRRAEAPPAPSPESPCALSLEEAVTVIQMARKATVAVAAALGPEERALLRRLSLGAMATVRGRR